MVYPVFLTLKTLTNTFPWCIKRNPSFHAIHLGGWQWGFIHETVTHYFYNLITPLLLVTNQVMRETRMVEYNEDSFQLNSSSNYQSTVLWTTKYHSNNFKDTQAKLLTPHTCHGLTNTCALLEKKNGCMVQYVQIQQIPSKPWMKRLWRN